MCHRWVQPKTDPFTGGESRRECVLYALWSKTELNCWQGSKVAEEKLRQLRRTLEQRESVVRKLEVGAGYMKFFLGLGDSASAVRVKCIASVGIESNILVG